MNVILIVSDTLRRDHLGCYGNRTVRTPHLDRFAESCLVFDHCYEASFPTVPTRADLMTGKWTFTYLGWNPLPESEITLAQALSAAGFKTAAVVDTPFLRREGYGYDRGFVDFIQVPGQGTERKDYEKQRRHEEDYCAPRTMIEAERWLERNYKDPFFLYVDTWDPHEPWDPPHWYVEPYFPGYDGRVIYPVPYHYWKGRVTAEELKIAHACYCGEITMVDRWVGRLLDRIESLGLMDKTAIIFTADHGFYFGEHGIFGKGVADGLNWLRSPLYEEVCHVPFLLYVPRLKPGRSDLLASLVDVMPTVIDLAGATIPDSVQGRSIISMLKKRKGRDFAVSSWQLLNPGGTIIKAVDGTERKIVDFQPITVSTKGWSLLYSAAGEKAELYNLRTDPKQKKNLIREDKVVAVKLHRQLLRMLRGAGAAEIYLEPRLTL